MRGAWVIRMAAMINCPATKEPNVRPRLPVQSRETLSGSSAEEIVDVLRARAAGGDLGPVCVRATFAGGYRVLFVRGDLVLGAGEASGAGLESIPVPAFLADLYGAEAIELLGLDLPLFLALEGVFRSRPSASIPCHRLDGPQLLARIRQDPGHAVLVLRRGAAHSIVVCWSGEPSILYPAEHEVFAGTTVAERLTRYVSELEGPDKVIEFYDGFEPGQTVTGRSLEGLLRAPEATEDTEDVVHCLTVRLKGRVVAQAPVHRHAITIGRDPGNDLVLDNLSVSRLHAEAQLVGDRIVVRDQWSENKLLVDGEQVVNVQLDAGDAFGIGKFVLTHEAMPTNDYVPFHAERKGVGDAVHETYAIPAPDAVAVVEHRGETHKMRGLVFTVGSGPNATLRVSGLWIAPQHLRIIRQPEGHYRLQHTAGGRRVRVNGTAVTDVSLTSGDEIAVGRHRLRFTLQPPASAVAQL